MPRLFPILLICALAMACSSPPALSVSPSPPVPTPASPSARVTRQAPASPGSLQLSGGVRGFLSLLAVNCSHEGSDLQVAMRGRVENVLYGVEITAPRAGEYQLQADSGQAVSVRLTGQPQTGSAVSRWSAGAGASAGEGALSISDAAGSIDADLQGLSGTGGSVHVQGSWSCG